MVYKCNLSRFGSGHDKSKTIQGQLLRWAVSGQGVYQAGAKPPYLGGNKITDDSGRRGMMEVEALRL